MKIYSEKTKEFYKTTDDCLKAEEQYDLERKEEAEKKKALSEKRKVRAKEVEDAYKAYEDAKKKYIELKNNFIKDFGSLHMTFSTDNSFTDMFDEIFRFI